MDDNLSNLKNKCNHSLVLIFDDHKPHKIGKIYHCFCPACSKFEHVYNKLRLENSSFKNSKIIDLSDIPMMNFNNYINQIIHYIFENYNYFYNNCSNEEIANSILSIVKSKENINENPKILKKN